MGRIFISFLGIGPEGEGYDSLKYTYNNTLTGAQTEFVQRAEIEALGPENFDEVFILCTNESYREFFLYLQSELINELNLSKNKISCEKINTNLSPKEQWKLFSLVNKKVQDYNRIVFDFTHGFRLLPIILSTSLSFIAKTKPELVLEHVFYGQKEGDREGKIIEMKDFYIINEWADGVSRLVDNADISKLAFLTSDKDDISFKGLKDQKLVDALEQLTSVIKNIDMNSVNQVTNNALSILNEKIKTLKSPEEQELLELVLNKFASLSTDVPLSGFYDKDYFQIQLEFIKLLNKHQLYMQSFTVMRELIVSIGMLGCTGKYQGKKIDSKDGRKYRRRFGDIFVNLCQFPREKWKYENEKKKHTLSENEMNDFNIILPFYEQLENQGIADELQGFVKEMLDYRNGFNHAWTYKKECLGDVTEKADYYLKKIENVIEKLKGVNLL